jgi:hypothetical protein
MIEFDIVVLVAIANHLDLESILNFRLVCKNFKEAADWIIQIERKLIEHEKFIKRTYSVVLTSHYEFKGVIHGLFKSTIRTGECYSESCRRTTIFRLGKLISSQGPIRTAMVYNFSDGVICKNGDLEGCKYCIREKPAAIVHWFMGMRDGEYKLTSDGDNMELTLIIDDNMRFVWRYPRCQDNIATYTYSLTMPPYRWHGYSKDITRANCSHKIFINDEELIYSCERYGDGMIEDHYHNNQLQLTRYYDIYNCFGEVLEKIYKYRREYNTLRFLPL